MDKIPLNFALMSNWYNWATIMLMVIIGGLAVAAIFGPAAGAAVTAED